MALDAILDAIEAETDAAVADIRADAASRVRSATEAADGRSHTERERLAGARDAAAAVAASRIVNQARLDADRTLRAAQEELFQRAVAELSERLQSLRASTSYPGVFAELLTEAHAALPEAGVIRVDPADADLAHAAVGELGLSMIIEATLDRWGGLELATGDGRMVENTLESRLYRGDGALRRLAVTACPELIRGL